MTKQPFSLMNTADFNKLVARTAKIGGEFDRNMQTLAVNAVGYAILHSDVTAATKVIKAMSKSARSKTMVAYLEHFAPVAWSEGKGEFAFYREAAKDYAFSPELMFATLWYEFKVQKVEAEINLEELFSDWLKKAENKLNKGDNKVEGDNKKMLEALKVFSAQYFTGKLEQPKPQRQNVSSLPKPKTEEKKAA